MLRTAQRDIAIQVFYILLLVSSALAVFTSSFTIGVAVFMLVLAQSFILLPYALEHGKRRGSHVYTHGAKIELLWSATLIAGLTIANYVWFFARHGISHNYVTVGTPMQLKASALAYLVITCCVIIYTIQQVTKERFIHKKIYREHIWRAAALSLACSGFLLYVPFPALFGSGTSLSLGDWLIALATAAIFAGIREFHHWDRQHHPRNVYIRDKHKV
jgi:magnesium-transporting ATPase (P-type)